MGNHEVWKPESIMAPGLMNSASEPERPDLFESDGEKYDWYIHVLRSRIYEYNAARIDCLLGKEGGSGRFDNARTALNEVIEDPEVEVTDDQGNTTVVRRFLRPDFWKFNGQNPRWKEG